MSNRPVSTLTAFLAGAIAACTSGPPPLPPVYRAVATDDTVMAPVVHVSDIAHLGSGSWAVLGSEEGVILRADFDSGTIAPYPGITREVVPGAAGLFGSGDTIYVADWALSRVTVWNRAGERIDAIPTPDVLGRVLPRARDAAGQWYFEVAPRLGSDGAGVDDSAAIVRSDPLMTRFDTLAMLRPRDFALVNRNGTPRREPRLLAGRDRWGVEPDGTLWVARVSQNQVVWYSPSGAEITRTDPLPDPVLPVTRADRQLQIKRYPEEQRPNVAMMPFAMVKPPFQRAFEVADGEVWLFASAVALDSVHTFKVVDSTGWIASVQVPSYGMALGVDGNVVIMGEENPEGIRMLRFRVPIDSIRMRLPGTSP